VYRIFQMLYGWVGSPDGPGLFETRQAIIDKADHSDIVKLSDKYVRHDDLPGTVASVLNTVKLYLSYGLPCSSEDTSAYRKCNYTA
jgi:hypothetical protein